MVCVKMEELYKYSIGTRVVVDNKRYMYVGKTKYDGTVELYDYATMLNVNEEEFDEDVEVCVEDVVDLDKLVEVKLRELLALVSDGWAIGGSMDLSGELEAYRLLVKIAAISKE